MARKLKKVLSLFLCLALALSMVLVPGGVRLLATPGGGTGNVLLQPGAAETLGITGAGGFVSPAAFAATDVVSIEAGGVDLDVPGVTGVPISGDLVITFDDEVDPLDRANITVTVNQHGSIDKTWHPNGGWSNNYTVLTVIYRGLRYAINDYFFTVDGLGGPAINSYMFTTV